MGLDTMGSNQFWRRISILTFFVKNVYRNKSSRTIPNYGAEFECKGSFTNYFDKCLDHLLPCINIFCLIKE